MSMIRSKAISYERRESGYQHDFFRAVGFLLMITGSRERLSHDESLVLTLDLKGPVNQQVNKH